MTAYAPDGTVRWERYITMPQADLDAGYSHLDNYVCSAESYREHLIDVFAGWHARAEVITGQWPQTLEECFGIAPKYSYPLPRRRRGPRRLLPRRLRAVPQPAQRAAQV